MKLDEIVVRLESAAGYLDEAMGDLLAVKEGADSADQDTKQFLADLEEAYRTIWSATATLATEAREQLEGHSHE